MSRTYRRTKGDQSHHQYLLRRHVKYPELYSGEEKEIIREVRRYQSDNGWVMSTPGWWTRMTANRPLRSLFREYATKVKHMVDLEDAPPFPKRLRRPWYW